MPDSPIPPYIDTRKVFQQRGYISGDIGLERLQRFQEYLAEGSAVAATVDLSFTTDESGQRLICGQLQASVTVICQRCLEPLAIELADDIRLVLLQDEAQAEKLQPALDPWICADHKLDIARLVEEQLILCLPIVNYHPTGDCLEQLNYAAPVTAADAGEKYRKSPFSILESLKDNNGSC